MGGQGQRQEAVCDTGLLETLQRGVQPSQIDRFRKLSKRRMHMTRHANVVLLRRFAERNNSVLACSCIHELELTVDRVHSRLSQVKQLTYSQAFRILREAAHALVELALCMSANWTLTPAMVGLDKQLGVKLWINEDFGLPYAQYLVANESPEDSQARQVQQLLRLVQGKLPGKIYPYQFSVELSQVNSMKELAGLLERKTRPRLLEQSLERSLIPRPASEFSLTLGYELSGCSTE